MEEELNEIMEDQEARIRQAEMKLNNGGTISEDDWTKMFRNIGRLQAIINETRTGKKMIEEGGEAGTIASMSVFKEL